MRYLATALLVVGIAGGQSAPLAPGELTYSVSDYRPEVTLVSKVAVVPVEVVVSQGWRVPVEGLTRDDFKIRDDGIVQRIASFEVERHAAPATVRVPATITAKPAVSVAPAPAKPRYVTFFVDDLNTDLYGLTNIRRGAVPYLAGGLAAHEWMAVATASGLGMQDFTQDPALIKAALNRVNPHPRGCNATDAYHEYERETTGTSGAPDVRAPGPIMGSVASRGGGRRGRASQNECVISGEIQARVAFDAILAQIEALGQAAPAGPGPADRVFLLASYGIFSEDTLVFGDKTERIVDAALRNHITINSLDTQGVGELLAATPDLNLMSNLSADTGGRIFFGDNDFTQGVRELAEPPELVYALSFQPEPPQTDGKRHKIEVTIPNRRGLDLTSRSAYFAPPPEAPGLEALRDAIRKAVLADTPLTGLPSEALVTTRAEAGVAVNLQLQTPSLPLRTEPRLHSNTVLAVAELFDSHGQSVAGQIGELDLRLPSDSLAEFQKPGKTVALPLKLRAPAGSYRLRTVIGEAASGRLSASNTEVVVP